MSLTGAYPSRPKGRHPAHIMDLLPNDASRLQSHIYPDLFLAEAKRSLSFCNAFWSNKQIFLWLDGADVAGILVIAAGHPRSR